MPNIGDPKSSGNVVSKKKRKKKNTGNARRRKKLKKLLESNDEAAAAKKRHLQLQKKQQKEKQKRKHKLRQREKAKMKEAKLSPEDLKKRIELNNEIAQFARRKQLSSAEAVFKKSKTLGLTNSYTFANMMNARVRCGDFKGAVALLRNPSANPGVVAFTTCIKGMFGAYDLKAAETLFSQMQSYGIHPNLRAINTFLRGCLAMGAMESGLDCYNVIKDKWKLIADASTHEYAVGLLCQGLRVAEASHVALKLNYGLPESTKDPEKPSEGISNICDFSAVAATQLNIGRAYALLGEKDAAKRALKVATDAVAMEESTTKSHQNSDDTKVNSVERIHGGKRAKDRIVADVSSETNNMIAARARSQVLFAEHRRNTIRDAISRVNEFLALNASIDSATLRARLSDSLAHLIVFQSNGANAGDAKTAPLPKSKLIDEKESIESILDTLRRNYGVGILDDASKTKVEKKIRSAFDVNGFISLHNLFEVSTDFTENDLNSKDFKTLPIKLEICSGQGEWVAAQAKADQNNALWGALEIRRDRSFQTWTNNVCNGGSSNLAVLCGDATQILSERFAAGTISRVFVNHPEPPQQSNSSRMSEASHLVTADFLRAIHRVLSPGGTVAVTTDNLWYARLLMDTAASLGSAEGAAGIFKQPELYNSQHEMVQGNVLLYRGSPDKQCGVTCPDATSYFDRLKKREKAVKERDLGNYFLYLEKVDVDSDRKATSIKKSSTTLKESEVSCKVSEPVVPSGPILLRVAGRDATARLRSGGAATTCGYVGKKITFDD